MILRHRFLKMVNYCIPKNDDYIYAVPHPNGKHDCYDLINCNSDNVLKTINYMLTQQNIEYSVVFLECYETDRMHKLQEYIDQNQTNNNLKIILVRSCLTYSNKLKKICNFINHLKRYRCNTWLTDTSSMMFDDRVRKQKLINMQYSTPLKLNPILYDFSYINYTFVTSLLCAISDSALYGVKLNTCFCTGFPRNDTLLSPNKGEVVKKWIKDKSGITPKYVLVYAPTYRDYSGAFSKSILGFELNGNELDDFLHYYDIVLITKHHPLQEKNNVLNSNRIVSYDLNFDFSLYDLLSESDALISDYSSVIHDYLISDKPIILNCFDKQKYDSTRGFCFDPIESVLPGPIVTNFSEFKNAIIDYVVTKNCNFDSERIKDDFHKYGDMNSTQRAFDLITRIQREEDGIDSIIG